MKTFSKMLTGAAAAALVTISAASPAQAQFRDRDRGIDAGDILTGVAVIGGIAAVASAIGNRGYNYNRGGVVYDRGYGYPNGAYGYPNGAYGYPNSAYGYGNQGYGEAAAVQACSYEAQRRGGGRVQITDVDRRSSNKFRVRGMADGGYNGGYGYNNYNGGISFECDARADGRITDFDTRRGYASRW